jgi:hypothetical protein
MTEETTKMIGNVFRLTRFEEPSSFSTERSDTKSVWPHAMVLLGAVLCASGCSRPATAPRAPTSPSGGTPNVSLTHVSGWSEDLAFRRLSGVRIEIVDGPQTGASVVTGDDGHFEFSGTLIGSVTVRATKEGFASETHTFTWDPTSQYQGYSFTLEPLGPSLALETGNYTVTMTGDRAASYGGAAACDGFPDDLLTRRYAATVVPWPAHPRTEFSVTLQLSNPAPIGSSVGFGMGICRERRRVYDRRPRYRESTAQQHLLGDRGLGAD